MMLQVHRFNETIALFLGNGDTVYLSPSDAMELATALNGCATDISNNKFTDSAFSTVLIERTKE